MPDEPAPLSAHDDTSAVESQRGRALAEDRVGAEPARAPEAAALEVAKVPAGEEEEEEEEEDSASIRLVSLIAAEYDGGCAAASLRASCGAAKSPRWCEGATSSATAGTSFPG